MKRAGLWKRTKISTMERKSKRKRPGWRDARRDPRGGGDREERGPLHWLAEQLFPKEVKKRPENVRF